MTKTDLSKYYGITITDIWDLALPKKLSALNNFKKNEIIIARIVIDKVDDYQPYEVIFKMCQSIGVEPMLQICDSALDAKLTDDEYNAREEWMLENLSEHCRFVEIANEIGPSTDWMSGKELQRAERSSKLWLGHERIVTYFWNYDFNEMGKYVDEHEIYCEHKLLSFYPRTLADFSELYHFFIPSRAEGLSECGMEEFQGKKSQKMTELVKRRAYAIGGPVMWWDWQNEF